MDFAFVTPLLAVGSAIAGPADVEALAGAGITHCLNVAEELDDRDLLAGSGIVYCTAGVPDDGQPKPESWFADCLDFALRGCRRGAGQTTGPPP